MAARKAHNLSSSSSSSGDSETPVSSATTSPSTNTVETVASSAERNRRITQFTVPRSSGGKQPRGVSEDRGRGRLDGGRRRLLLRRVGEVPVVGLRLGILVGVTLREGA